MTTTEQLNAAFNNAELNGKSEVAAALRLFLEPVARLEAERGSEHPQVLVTDELIRRLRTSDTAGLVAYGKTVDRKDLSAAEWLDHATDEMLDAAKYMQAAKREVERLEAELAAEKQAHGDQERRANELMLDADLAARDADALRAQVIPMATSHPKEKMSNTPRTDAFRYHRTQTPAIEQALSLARVLERELAEAQRERDAHRVLNYYADFLRVKAERDAALASLAEAKADRIQAEIKRDAFQKQLHGTATHSHEEASRE